MQSPPSLRPSVRPSVYTVALNQMTSGLDRLHVYGHDHSSPGLKRSEVKVKGRNAHDVTLLLPRSNPEVRRRVRVRVRIRS